MLPKMMRISDLHPPFLLTKSIFRLRDHEEKLNQLLSLVRGLPEHDSGRSTTIKSSLELAAKLDAQERQGHHRLETMLDPTSLAFQSSPIEVLRDIGRRYHGSRRQAFNNSDLDLVSHGVLDRNAEDNLIS